MSLWLYFYWRAGYKRGKNYVKTEVESSVKMGKLSL